MLAWCFTHNDVFLVLIFEVITEVRIKALHVQSVTKCSNQSVLSTGNWQAAKLRRTRRTAKMNKKVSQKRCARWCAMSSVYEECGGARNEAHSHTKQTLG